MAHPDSPQQMERDYVRAERRVTEGEYCDRQVNDLGVRPSVCAERYRYYHRAVTRPGVGERYLYDYEHR